jgi:hypothetical protein
MVIKFIYEPPFVNIPNLNRSVGSARREVIATARNCKSPNLSVMGLEEVATLLISRFTDVD